MAEQQDVEADALPSFSGTPTSPDISAQYIPAQSHQQSAPTYHISNAASKFSGVPPKIEHFDVALVVSKGDEEIGDKILDDLSSLQLKNGQRPKVCLSDDPHFHPDKIQKANPILKVCTLIFVVLTGNIGEDEATRFLWHEAIGMTRLAPKDEVDESKRYCVRPLHTLCEKTRRGVYKTPCGLTSIDSIDWYEFENPWFQKRMARLFEFYIPYRQKRELQQSGSTIPAVPTQIHPAQTNPLQHPQNLQMPRQPNFATNPQEMAAYLAQNMNNPYIQNMFTQFQQMMSSPYCLNQQNMNQGVAPVPNPSAQNPGPGTGLYEAFESMNLNQGSQGQIHETSGSQSLSEDGGSSSLQTVDNCGEEDKMAEGFTKDQPQSKTQTPDGQGSDPVQNNPQSDSSNLTKDSYHSHVQAQHGETAQEKKDTSLIEEQHNGKKDASEQNRNQNESNGGCRERHLNQEEMRMQRLGKFENRSLNSNPNIQSQEPSNSPGADDHSLRSDQFQQDQIEENEAISSRSATHEDDLVTDQTPSLVTSKGQTEDSGFGSNQSSPSISPDQPISNNQNKPLSNTSESVEAAAGSSTNKEKAASGLKADVGGKPSASTSTETPPSSENPDNLEEDSDASKDVKTSGAQTSTSKKQIDSVDEKQTQGAEEQSQDVEEQSQDVEEQSQVVSPPSSFTSQQGMDTSDVGPFGPRSSGDGMEVTEKTMKTVSLQTSPDLEEDVGKAHVSASGPAHRSAKCGAPNTAAMEKEGLPPTNAVFGGPPSPSVIHHYHHIVGPSGGGGNLAGVLGGGDGLNIPPEIIDRLPLNTARGNAQQFQTQQRQMPDPPRPNADGHVEWNSKGQIVINNCEMVQIGPQGTINVQDRINRISPDQENNSSVEDSSISSSAVSVGDTPPPYSRHDPNSTNLKTAHIGYNSGAQSILRGDNPDLQRGGDSDLMTPSNWGRGSNSSQSEELTQADSLSNSSSNTDRGEMNFEESGRMDQFSGLAIDGALSSEFQDVDTANLALPELNKQTGEPGHFDPLCTIGLSDFTSYTVGSSMCSILHESGQDLLNDAENMLM